MVLYAYMCCVFLIHRESPDMILIDKFIIFWGGSVTGTKFRDEEAQRWEGMQDSNADFRRATMAVSLVWEKEWGFGEEEGMP
jgi:hypothetical protein